MEKEKSIRDIKLGKNQEIGYVSNSVADNGIVISFDIVTKSLSKNGESWDSRQYVYKFDEKDKAIADLTFLYNLELERKIENYNKKLKSKK